MPLHYYQARMQKIALEEYCSKENIIQLIRTFDEIKKTNRLYIDSNNEYLIIESDSSDPVLPTQKDIDLLLIIREIIFFNFSQSKDIESVYRVFNEVYDDLCYDILFKKIILPKKVRTILEVFASPIYSVDAYIQKKIIHRYLERTSNKKTK